MLSKFFIHRPIFAGVLAIIVMAFGLFATFQLPVERYPDIAPPRITVSATYTCLLYTSPSPRDRG